MKPTAAVIVALSFIVLGACGSGAKVGGSPPDVSVSSGLTGSATSPAASSPLEGTWQTAPMSCARLNAAAELRFTTTDIRRSGWRCPVGSRFAAGIRIGAGRWVQYQVIDGGSPDIGWEGTYAPPDGREVTATETATGCRIMYRYAIREARLSVDVLRDTCGPDIAAQTLIYESAPFTRAG